MENEKQVEQVKQALKDLTKPIKVRKIKFRDRENDIRKLSYKDIRQLTYRHQQDNLAYHKLELDSLTNIELYLSLIVEKLYGVPANKLLDEKMLDWEENYKGE